MEFLSEFYFVIIYRKGNKNGRADAFSRRPDHQQELTIETHAILIEDTKGNLVPNRQLDAIYKV